MKSFLAALTIAAALLAAPVDAALALVYSVQRHGARNQLPKTSLLKESESLGGPTLLPQGQRMCFNAGNDFRQRYIDPTTCGATGTCLDSNSSTDAQYGLLNFGRGYHNYNTRVRASYTDRAILSAQAFFSGIFPANVTDVNGTWGVPTGQQMIPVYTVLEENDWLIRAYTKCNTYNQNLLNWYASDAFLTKAADTAALRATVKQYVPTLDTNLTNWWNVYDAINTWHTFGVGEPQPPIGQPQIDNATWAATLDLAYWLETSKMKSDLTQNLLGGPLVADMLQNMQSAIEAVKASKSVYYKLLSISSHYNVQLGVLSALQLDKYPPAVAALNWLNATLPQLASVVVFELHTGDSNGMLAANAAVRLVVQPGPGKPYITVPMSCSAAGDAAEQLAGPGACTWDSFRQLASPAGLSSANAWCTSCGNVDATPCALVASNNQLASVTNQLANTQAKLASSNEGTDTVSQSQFNTAVAVGVVVTCLGTLAISAALFGVLYMRAKKRWQTQEPGNLASKLSSAQQI